MNQCIKNLNQTKNQFVHEKPKQDNTNENGIKHSKIRQNEVIMKTRIRHLKPKQGK